MAPASGWVAPLEETPDPVFAGKMLGDGLAIDPIDGVLYAPCNGRVIAVHRACHAVTVQADNGAEILMHVGLDTVALGGEGFVSHVTSGQSVVAGDRLLSFDMDLIAQRASSLVIPVILVNGDDYEIVQRRQDLLIRFGEPLFEMRTRSPEAQLVSSRQAEAEVSRAVVVMLAHGLHARPAARIVDAAKGLDARVTLTLNQRSANGRSAVSIMSLAVKCGDTLRVEAAGPQADEAVAAICALIESGMGEKADPSAARPVAVAAAAPPPFDDRPAFGTPSFRGVSAAPGLAIGRAVRHQHTDLVIVEDGGGEGVERGRLMIALAQLRERLRSARDAATADGARRGILEAHLAMLDDPELKAAANQNLASGKSAAGAWRGAVTTLTAVLHASGDRRMAERAADLKDIERQTLQILAGAPDHRVALGPDAIILADDLLPSDLMALDGATLAGVCLERGGPTSHIAILAGAMGVPMLVAAGPAAASVADGATMILDGDTGAVWVDPDAAALTAAEAAVADRKARHAAALAASADACRMSDGTRIEVFANVGSLADARSAVINGAEGCGLLRTEFLFLERDTPPSEDEQLRQYQAIADALNGRPLIVRTLDVGGDKAAPYLPIPAEENPALGLRGVRVSLWKPELLRAQLRAILRVLPQGQCKIMVPMVADLEELRAVRRELEAVKGELGLASVIELGVMVETPAAAVSADILSREADFLSIGTNDLTQYVLARDRGNPQVAAGIDALHPAVLRLIGQTCSGGALHGRWVGVCGGLASDPLAAPILIGLGVRELSATAAVVPELKARIRDLTLTACEALAREALAQTSSAAVRTLATAFLRGA